MLRLAVIFCVCAMASAAAAGDWPGFRGPGHDGIGHATGLPTHWSSTQNVTWSVQMPMPGNSSPVVWGDMIFVTGAVDGGAERVLMGFNRNTGGMLWHSAVRFEGKEPTHETNPYASSTPVTDGQRVYVWFGSAGFAAFDFEGNVVWQRDLGAFEHIWGNASSPVLFEDMVILYAGPGPRSILIAMNRATGEIIYQHELPDAAGPVGERPQDWKGSWSTPVIYDNAGRLEMLLSLPQYIAGFSPRTGKELWRCYGLSDLVYTSPVIGKDVVVAMSGYGGPSIGLKHPGPDASGDITATHRLWRSERNPQRIGSGVILGDHLYFVNEPGIAECMVAATGETLWRHRLGANIWGSLIYVDGRFYATDTQGATHLFAPSPTSFTLIASNGLAEPEMTRATPAYSEGQIFIRTYDRLYCIGERKQ